MGKQHGGWDVKIHVKRYHKKSYKCSICSEELVGFIVWSKHTKDCFFKCDKCDFKHRVMSKYEGHLQHQLKVQSKDEDDTEYTQRVTVIYK